mmetsp:Transcript_11585/g.48680  ORF Transcript_11585/g.48680 Transcript_11585/m.48680 type:complete len:352 (+) Transcript_11585:449-1504(+)
MRSCTAASRSCGRLVHPITMTRSSERVFMPSQLLMNSFLILRIASCSLEDDARLLSIESISSMNMTVGAILLASEKSALTHFSPSPNHLEAMLDIETLMKFAPASVATARASIVLPVPGGPNRSTPLHGCVRLPRLKSSGRLSGSMTNSLRVSLTLSSAPMSSKRTPTSSAGITSLSRRFSNSFSSAALRSLPLAPPSASPRAVFSSAMAALMHAAGNCIFAGMRASTFVGVAGPASLEAGSTSSIGATPPRGAALPTACASSAAATAPSAAPPPSSPTAQSAASCSASARTCAAGSSGSPASSRSCRCFESAHASTRSASVPSIAASSSSTSFMLAHSRWFRRITRQRLA